jgi:replicative DNA helicase
MAKALNCHIILLSQLNRKTEDKQRPTMAELRESGAIEQDASNILLMWNLKTEGEKGLKVEKCRNGVLGGLVLGFDGSHMTFSELDKELEEEEKWETRKKTPFS